MKLTRGQFVGGAAASALVGAGVYELVDKMAAPPRRGVAGPRGPEQHLLEGVRVIRQDDVEIVVPPLHHELVTASLRLGEGLRDLRAASEEMEGALRRLDSRFASTPAGLGVTVGWGRSYFDRYFPAHAKRHIPLDVRATATLGRPVRVLEDAIRFPSDPDDTRLESNDLAVLLRSDSLDHIAVGAKALFEDLDGLFRVTSIRKGFVGGGFEGGVGLPKQMALAAGVEGADLIPNGAQLFLGFTSTQKTALGPSKIANLETLGYADLATSSYFVHGTNMHVSHIVEDLAAWYLTFDFRDRVDTTFRPGLVVARNAQTVPQGVRDAQTGDDVRRDFEDHRRIGHAGSVQPTSRLAHDVTGPDGTRYPKGTAIPQRADFNTLDNPFFWSADTVADGHSDTAAAGLHFIVFNPTSDDFRRNRLAMDGVLPDGTRLPFERGSLGQGFNSVLRTTHRQNFLVPPRAHRSLPLSELRS